MANVKISELPAAAAVLTTQEFEVNDSGTSKKVTGSQIESFIKSNFIASDLKSGGDLTIADKIVHTNDTNTSIRFPVDDTVTVETAGAERMRITSTGNVGIGTNNPAVSLQVGGSATPQVRLLSTTNVVDLRLQAIGASSSAIIGTLSNHPLAVFTNNLERMRITAAGNVGIGTTNPTATLTVDGTVGGTVIASQVEAEAGTVTDKLMTPQRVEQAINVQAEGMILLGTLTTTSGTTQTLSGLNLAGYKYLMLDINGIGHSSGTSQHINFGAGQLSANGLQPADVLVGTAWVSLITGVLLGGTSRQALPNSTSVQISQTGYSTATTSVSVSTAAGGTFDAGSVRIYGVR